MRKLMNNLSGRGISYKYQNTSSKRDIREVITLSKEKSLFSVAIS